VPVPGERCRDTRSQGVTGAILKHRPAVPALPASAATAPDRGMIRSKSRPPSFEVRSIFGLRRSEGGHPAAALPRVPYIFESAGGSPPS
jgi:hypothetical protein